jgi:hypothetical protein
MRSARKAKKERSQSRRAWIRINIGARWMLGICQSTIRRRLPWVYHPPGRNPFGFNANGELARDRNRYEELARHDGGD